MKDVKILTDNGVNVQQGLELFGDMEMYDETLSDFLDMVAEKLTHLENYKTNDMPNYAIDVHSLKSDARYLGFTTLADLSYESEMKSKAGDNTFILENHPKIIAESKRVIALAQQYLGREVVDLIPNISANNEGGNQPVAPTAPAPQVEPTAVPVTPTAPAPQVEPTAVPVTPAAPAPQVEPTAVPVTPAAPAPQVDPTAVPVTPAAPAPQVELTAVPVTPAAPAPQPQSAAVPVTPTAPAPQTQPAAPATQVQQPSQASSFQTMTQPVYPTNGSVGPQPQIQFFPSYNQNMASGAQNMSLGMYSNMAPGVNNPYAMPGMPGMGGMIPNNGMNPNMMPNNGMNPSIQQGGNINANQNINQTQSTQNINSGVSSNMVQNYGSTDVMNGALAAYNSRTGEQVNVPPIKKGKILVIDDSNLVANFVKKIFSTSYDVEIANNGQAGIDFLNNPETNQKVRACLLDLNMPGMSGLEVLDYFYQNGIFVKTPVAVISGAEDKETLDKVSSYPIVDILSKPFNDRDIKKTVEKCLAVYF